MGDTDDLPYRAEYAKSSRASCKGCKDQITKESLRLAVMIQAPKFDGKIPNWFHYACFFGRNKVKNVGDIAHFEELRWEDQQKIKGKIDGAEKAVMKEQTSSVGTLTNFSTDYAKSSRSTCRGCSEKILKGIVRVSKKDFESENSRRYGPQDHWYHLDCFVENRSDLEFFAAAERLQGFSSLNAEDQQLMKKKLPEKKSLGPKKRAAETETDATAPKKPKNNEEEKKLKEQNDILFKFRDKLKKEISKKDMQELLEFNDQEIASGESKLLDRIADGLAFGALDPCPECKDGQLVYQREGYRCHGNMTDWTACTYTTKTPKRKPFLIPDELKADSFLKTYKFKPRERFFPTETALVSSASLEAAKSSGHLPLNELKFVICGKLTKPKSEITKAIQRLGGKLTDKINDTVIACISNEAEVKSMKKKTIQEAQNSQVFVVSEDFIDAVTNGGPVISSLTQKSICSWGSEALLQGKIGDVVDSKASVSKSKSSADKMYTKNLPEKRKVNVKGSAAVDPDSGLEDIAHVLEEKDNIYDAVLGLVDIVRGTNSYYKIQLLASDKGHKYWLFRSWGRVGTTIGSNKKENFHTRAEAVEAFCALYEEKTGNEWSKRKNFVKFPKRFYPVDIDYGQDDENMKKLSDIKANSKSKLHKAIQDLVCMFFDVETMKKTMVEFEIDLKKMPLGKLSRRQIESAYLVLTELQQLNQLKDSSSKILDASNRFYTLIPHDFGLRKPTPLDKEDLIKQKIDMLDNLLEIEVAYNILKSSEDDADKDPIDAYYEKLKTEIEILDKKSEEFKLISDYTKNTHASTHNQYSLEIVEAFKIKRQGEDKRYKPFKSLHNRQLLWHGSRVTNYAGILSQGLRIAPPEAPVTGYMFGKGVYFADMVSKSANYCCTNKSNPIGVMLLSEVALGNMHELTNADFITKLPPGKHSTKGIGRTCPDPKKKFVDKHGVEIPYGPGKDAGPQNTSLLYNEYIVYDVAQINIKYLLKMKFNWKY